MSRPRTLAALLCLMAATGCSSEYWVNFASISDAPASVTVSRDLIEIPAGLAVGVMATPVEDGKAQDVPLDLVTVRNGIVGIERSLEDEQWVIYGIAPGSTAVEIYFEDELVAEMPAVVTEQQ